MKHKDHIDPALYDHVAEQRAQNEKLIAMGENLPERGTVKASSLRRFRTYNKDGSIKPPQHPSAYEEMIDCDGREVKTRVFPAENHRGIALHYHGGGWALGSVYEQDAYLANIAEQTELTVVTIDYPLAPEHQLPEILDVGLRAMRHIITANPDGPVAILGESAGGNVALNCLIALKQEPELLQRVCVASFCYPVTDLSMTPSLRLWDRPFIALSKEWMEWFIDMVLPGVSRDDRSDPAYSPLYADVIDLPPAIFSVGELEPLYDDTLFMYERWRTAGNTTQLQVYPEAPHGFNSFPTQMAAACNSRIHAFINTQLAEHS